MRTEVRDGARWLIVLLIALVVIGLVSYARGPDHHRGDDAGALHAVAAHADLASREARHG
jgi:ABC-type transport system involved in cytochrome c biogenesis permease component